MNGYTVFNGVRNTRRWMGIVAAAAVVGVSAPAVAQQDQNVLVTAAQSTFSDFQRDPDMTWFRANVGKARAGDRTGDRQGGLDLRWFGRSRRAVLTRRPGKMGGSGVL